VSKEPCRDIIIAMYFEMRNHTVFVQLKQRWFF
jgi:hypothetical protein